VLARKAQDCPQLLLAFSQFVVCALASLLCANWLEAQLLPDDLNGWLWIALNGVIVVGVAYTLQVVVMQWADPLTASLIFALESVFGGLAGYLVYHEQMTLVAFVGAIMMLLGCVLVQLPKTHKT
jgi:drug/metabolite transporter (DMT)-like permease